MKDWFKNLIDLKLENVETDILLWIKSNFSPDNENLTSSVCYSHKQSLRRYQNSQKKTFKRINATWHEKSLAWKKLCPCLSSKMLTRILSKFYDISTNRSQVIALKVSLDLETFKDRLFTNSHKRKSFARLFLQENAPTLLAYDTTDKFDWWPLHHSPHI